MMFIRAPNYRIMNIPIKFNMLKKSGPLSRLLSQARLLATLDNQLKRLLEAPLDEHCQVLALHDQTLVVAVDSPVWAARLRFHTPRLIKLFSRSLSVPVHNLRVRVCPVSGSPAPVKQPVPARRGTAGKQALLQAAQTVSDPELKSALQKLASHYEHNR
jgi:hypothetical protein